MQTSMTFIDRYMRLVYILILGLVMASCLQKDDSSTVESMTLDPLEADLGRILLWLPGEYDNHQQVYREAVQGVPMERRHRQTHHIFSRVTAEFIPGHLIYAQQSQHYDLNDIYRQRIYSFDIDKNEQVIVLTIYTPHDPSQLIDAHLNPNILPNMTLEDFFLKPGCEVYWTWDGAQFNGYLKENECSYYSEKFGKTVYLNETLTLRSDALLLDDSAVDQDGNLVFGVHDKGPTINFKE